MNFDVTIKLFGHDKNSLIFLERKDCVKYLGVLIDSKLTWKQRILFISSKIRKALEIISSAPVAQLVEHRAVTREVVSSPPAGPTLRVFK